jgi:hypothetical protein
MKVMPDHTYNRLIRNAETAHMVSDDRVSIEIVAKRTNVEIRGSVTAAGRKRWFSEYVEWIDVKEAATDPLARGIEQLLEKLKRFVPINEGSMENV